MSTFSKALVTAAFALELVYLVGWTRVPDIALFALSALAGGLLALVWGIDFQLIRTSRERRRAHSDKPS
ncbi:MAG: hypothetical protein QOD08_916 [Gaiellaceae bacterium]|nr:hypothetical protein [Gaiellaceae bacterium]